MGLLDVSELMDDLDFIEPLVLIRRTENVDNFGQNVLTECPASTHGSVQAISGRTLARLPEALRVANVQEFYIREKIITDGRSKYPDIIVKKGIRFAVQAVFDWSDYGRGYSQGTCVAESPSGGWS